MKPFGAHFVGSVGLDTVEDVFRVVGTSLGKYLKRIPDGEVGGRRLWISWQYPVLRAHPLLRPDPNGAVRPTNKFQLLTLGEGVNGADIHFGELGYAREARASYIDFLAARERGEVQKDARFQVCLPTPFAVVSSVVLREALDPIEKAYEAAMLREVASLCKHIPHKDLCIQWDVCNEMVIWDGLQNPAVPFPDTSKDSIIARMQRLCAAVPADVELGIHLCYGDFGGKHFAEPVDAGAITSLANALTKNVRRLINYIHMPIPHHWKEERQYAPLKDLQLNPATEIYLGLVAAVDGVKGAQERIALASKYVPAFGVSTECGISRARTEATVMALLKTHVECCA